MPANPKDLEKVKILAQDYELVDGLLWKRQPIGVKDQIFRLAVPATMIRQILEDNHNASIGAHLGIHRTYSKIVARYHWYL